jgi:glycerol uptake facilitator-like aquaporin
MDQRSTDALIQLAAEKEIKAKEKINVLETVIEEKVKKDKSPEARLGRMKMTIRAVYGEFMCALLFYGPIFGTLMNFTLAGDEPELTSLAVAFVGGFQAIGVSFAFSSVSGAHFNSSISFALWLTGKLSNRRLVFYVFAQLLASVVAMAIMTGIFHGDLSAAYNACTVTPGDDRTLGRVFATEFFLTFFLTYIAFTVAFEEAESQKKENMSFKSISDSKGLTLYASTPQSKSGFAPFAIGLTIFSLSLIGGTSGGAFNPGRIFGPALFANRWDYLWLYWIGEVVGASTAGLLVTNLHRFGLKEDKHNKVEETSAVETLGKALTKAKDNKK